jgi:DNA-binding transcriptional LysR family regulator
MAIVPGKGWADRIGRRIRLRDLHVLMAVVQWGSMAKAAEHLAVSQPVVSKAIADLEHVLGARVLDRDRHGAQPTVYGEALLRRGTVVFEELRDAVKEVEFLLDATVGELRIAAADPIASGLVPAAISRLSATNPGVVYHVTGGASALDVQCQALRERKFDLIVGRLPESVVDADLDVEVLAEEPSLIVAGANNPLTKRRKLQLADLMDAFWVLPSAESFVGALVARMFQSQGLSLPRKAVYCTSMQMNNALLATGRYLAFYPASTYRLAPKPSALRALAVRLPIPSTPLGIITLRARTLSHVAQLFIQQLRLVAKA